MIKKTNNVNAWFEKLGEKIIKLRAAIIGAFILINVIAVAGLSFIKFDTSIESWFLKDDPIKVATDEFEDIFGNAEYVGILVEAEDVFAPEILTLMRELGEELEMEIPYSDKVISLADMEFSRSEYDEIIIDNLIPDPVPRDMAEIEEIRSLASSKKSIKGKIFSDDFTQAWITLRLNPFPKDWGANRKRVTSEFKELLKNEKKLFLSTYNKNPRAAYDLLIAKLQEFTGNNRIRIDYSHLLNETHLALATKKNIFTDITKYIGKEINAQTMEPSMRVGKAVLDLLDQEKYQKYTLLPVGTAVNTYEELHYFETFMGKVLLGAFVLCLALLVVFLRSIPGFVIPLITTVSSIVIVLGFSGFLGVKANATLMTVPIFLGFAVSIGYSVHIFNFFNRHFKQTGKRRESVLYAVSHTAWPIFFTALTTVGSLLSFLFINLGPLRWLGVTSAAVIFTVYLIVMTMTPVFLSFGKNKQPGGKAGQTGEVWTDRLFIPFGKWVFQFQIPIVIIFAIVMGIFAYGVTRLKIDVNIESSYGLKVPYVARMSYVGKSKIGSMSGYNVTVDFNERDKIKDPEVLERLDTFRKSIEQKNMTKRTTSILETIKDMNQMFNEDNPVYYRIPGKVETIMAEEYRMVDGKEVLFKTKKEVSGKAQVSNLLLMYEMSGGSESTTWVNDDYSMARILVETTDLSAREIKAVMVELEKEALELFPDATYRISGAMPQMEALNSYVAIGQIKSFIIALLVIIALMMIVFRSIKSGLIGMIPNFTPAIVVAGLLGLLGIPLDFFTVTIIPMILGLAVDDTIHFISHYKQEFDETNDYYESSLRTFKTVGKSLFTTSVIIICGFSIYMTSPAMMLFNLGIFIVVGIASALISDYLMTPILIRWAKPFGKEKKK